MMGTRGMGAGELGDDPAALVLRLEHDRQQLLCFLWCQALAHKVGVSLETLLQWEVT